MFPQMRSIIVIIALGIAAIAGCSGGSSPTVAPNVTAQQQASASKSMGLTFPPETHFFLYHRTADKLPAFDPVGASSISHRMVSNIDTSDRWFMFTMSEGNFESLMFQLAAYVIVPTPLPWSPDTRPP